MAMEVVIEGEDGSRLSLQCTEARNTVIGRGCGGGGSGFHAKDRTVSRRHVSFQVCSDSEEPRVSFEVIGRNPFWVQQGDLGLKVFRKFDKGQLELGDRFSLSAVAPLWFHFNFKDLALNNNQVSSSKARVDFDVDQIDLSQFDPVKEFGFLVIGHEFDEYPKGKIRNAKDWEWFLEEGRKDIDEDEDEDEEGKQRRRNMKRKQKKKGKDDEEWGGQSDDEDMNLVSNMSKGKRPCYSTRSKDRQGATTSSKPKTVTNDDDDDDETLGGFIVNDEENDQLEELDDDDEEEEFEEEEED
ncbi:hypothetical protein PIB30_068778 [Stylosanthes scabra]|uniref:FHA domain-containing protein n=1 Tax=Stylosanthes scabra TaxID=79078 RepID=A0ABU6RP55_9FABA|nr:hypothetical protein [Stylosanthes scabra]